MRKLLYTPTEAARALGMGRTTLYRLLATGDVESIKVGGSRRIPAAALETYVQGLRDAQRADRADDCAVGSR